MIACRTFYGFAFFRAQLTCSHKTQKSFVFGNACGAPVKKLSRPKLEIQFALLVTRVKDDLLKALKIKLGSFYLCTDSTSFLQWLNSDDNLPGFLR